MSPKEIMILNLIFSSSLGIVALMLLAGSLRRSRRPKREDLFLSVRRDGVLFRKILLKTGRYRIGRGRECDIILEGRGIPLMAGEFVADKGLSFRTLSEYSATKNRERGLREFEVAPGDEVGLFNYSLCVEKA